MIKNVDRLIVLLALVATMQACSLGKTYQEINPQDAERRMKDNNGYHALKSVTPGKAKLVFRSEGMGIPVAFSICLSSPGCSNPQDIGVVTDGGYGVLLPWIADLTSRSTKGFIELEVTPADHIHVKGDAKWSSGGTSGNPVVTSRSCGPLWSTFSAIENHAYLVRFIWSGKSDLALQCKLEVLDATNPDDSKLVKLQ